MGLVMHPHRVLVKASKNPTKQSQQAQGRGAITESAKAVSHQTRFTHIGIKSVRMGALGARMGIVNVAMLKVIVPSTH